MRTHLIIYSLFLVSAKLWLLNIKIVGIWINLHIDEINWTAHNCLLLIILYIEEPNNLIQCLHGRLLLLLLLSLLSIHKFFLMQLLLLFFSMILLVIQWLYIIRYNLYFHLLLFFLILIFWQSLYYFMINLRIV